ncbi:MAG: methyltransferase domain-containing protein [Deltaproteobacteria bacterium]|nr:methyltransferase domain-containing protein [Deltaproteobacteria bacterium]
MKTALEEIYGPRFFARRHRLNWRAPIVCAAIKEVFEPTSVIDAGCATGDLVVQFMTMSIDAYGIEGSRAAIPYLECPISRIFFYDLRKSLPGPSRRYDLAICFEVAEHIEPKHADQFVLNLVSLSGRILMSAAPPGQRGHHHVNCQPPGYWVNKFWQYGFFRNLGPEERFKAKLSPWARKKGIKAYYENSLYFERSVHD